MFAKPILNKLKLFSLAIIASCVPFGVEAQITPDGTTATDVSTQNNSTLIEQGDRAGNNLFHSFSEFSIPTGGEAFFDNPQDIVNIFNRVTGGNISNIDGLLRANGGANVFLINPAGIVFGENASLSIGGSFFGSTADSILFPDGVEFSASELEKPFLTVNAPIGLGFRDNPGDITVNGSLLEVPNGESLSLIGGNLTIEGREFGSIFAIEGRVELGGLTAAGEIGINGEDSATEFNLTSLDFPEDIARGDVTFSNFAFVSVAGNNGGDIAVNARNITLTSGEFGTSQLDAGIVNGGFEGAQAGDIVFDATGEVNLTNRSNVLNQVLEENVGNGGNIEIKTTDLIIRFGSNIQTNLFGEGSTGKIIIDAANDITVSDFSKLDSSVADNAIGNSGGIEINTTNLLLDKASALLARVNGEGNSRGIEIIATGDVIFDLFSLSDSSSLITEVSEIGRGNSGDILIEADRLVLNQGSQLQSRNAGQGNAGNIQVTARRGVTLTGIKIDDDIIDLDNVDEDAVFSDSELEAATRSSGIISTVGVGVTGNGGSITINSPALRVEQGAVIDSTTEGIGNAGKITIESSFINLDYGRILSEVTETSVGNSPGIEINGESIIVDNFSNAEPKNLAAIGRSDFALSRISASTAGEGNGGDITFNIDNILLDNDSLVNSAVLQETRGNAGDITFNADSVEIFRASRLLAATAGEGKGGGIKINASKILLGDRIFGVARLESSTFGVGDAGNISIVTDTLELNTASMEATTFDNADGNAGNITIQSSDNISLNESLIFSRAGINAGNGGDIEINTGNLSLTNGSQINNRTLGRGNAGNIAINARNSILMNRTISNRLPSRILSDVNNENATGNAGKIEINTANLTLSDEAIISNTTIGKGNANSIQINASESLAIANAIIESRAGNGSTGDAGSIDIDTGELTLDNGGEVSVSNLGAGNSGNVTLKIADNLILQENSSISALATELASGGNIDIDAEFVFAFPDTNSDIVANAQQGAGGNINIATQAIFGLNEQSSLPINQTNDIDASSQFGTDGRVFIDTPDVAVTQGIAELPENVISPQAFTSGACGGGRGRVNYILTGKGGVPPAPDLPLQSLIVNNGDNTSKKNDELTPKAINNIVPARGVIVKENGQIVLTAHSTLDNKKRTLTNNNNCHFD